MNKTTTVMIGVLVGAAGAVAILGMHRQRPRTPEPEKNQVRTQPNQSVHQQRQPNYDEMIYGM